MAARNKPYEQFGPYILFKKFEMDSLGDLWRAGRIENGQVGPTLALRRLSGGNRAELSASAESVAQLLPRLTGPSFARDQVAGVTDGVPFLAWDYAGGRSLRHIIDRARGGKDVQPNPLPLDQAIVVAEKVALSLATMGDLRDTAGTRLSHGALLPQLIWISDDGEIRVAGQQIAGGIVASLADPKVNAEIGRYFAPEFRTSGEAPKPADVYGLGAILFLLVTGQEPPDAMTASAFVAAVRAVKTMTGAPVPDDIRVILDKSFNLDPSMRYASMTEMKQALSALAHGGKYSASTFNLAFYLSNLLKKEMETEAIERDKESKFNVAPYLDPPKAASTPAPAPSTPAIAVPMFAGALDEPGKSKLPVAIAAAVAIAIIGLGAWLLVGRNSAQPVTTTSAKAQMVPTASPAPAMPEPIRASGGATTTAAPAATTSADPAAQKRAFEDAVRQKLQAEMAKLNDQYMAELQRQQSKNAPVAAPAPAAPAPVADDRPAVTAAQLDQQRREAARQEEVAETGVPAPLPDPQTQTVAPASQPVAPAPAPAPVQVPTVREGDVVLYNLLDAAPRATRQANPVYPAPARQQRVSGNVLLSVLIDENGQVTDVKVLKGINRFGIDEAAVRAMKAARFTSPMKDGKRVKTWMPQTVQFQP